jgi:hypothetical protein
MSEATPKKKKSLIRRIFKWTGITILVLLILIIIAPFIFKDKIVALVKEEANKNLNAKVDFGDFDLTLFSSFPDFRFVINKVNVIGVDSFANDTLAYIDQLKLDINLKSVIAGDKYQVNSIVIDKARILGKVLYNGKANWDIAKPSTDSTGAPTPSEPSKFAAKLEELKIKDAYIVYNDEQGGMYARLEGFNYELNADVTQDIYNTKNILDIAKTTFRMSGMNYLKDVHVKADMALNMDMPNMKFTFKENSFSLNDLTLNWNGWLAMPKSDIDMDLSFKAQQTEFKSILSLIPSVYSKDFASVQTAGKLALSGMTKGTYNDKTYPAFGVELIVSEAMFKYPSLPKSVNNINIDVKVNNPTGVLDETKIDVNKFHMEMAGNPINMTAHIKTPISDPDIQAEVKALIVLTSVKEFIPMEAGDEMNGTIKADIAMAGRLSAIEKQQYENFKASGSLEIDKMNYKSAAFPYGVMLNVMQMNFTTQHVELASLDAKMGNTDIQANGKIENFLQYVFKDDLIKGSFNVTGNLIDLNQLMGPSSTETAAATPTTATTSTASGVVEVPGNIDFNLNAKFGKILYTNITIENLSGGIIARNKKLDMSNLKMNVLGGGVGMNGYYETTNPKRPTAMVDLNLENFDIQNTFNTFNSVQKLVPIGKYAKGSFSASIKDFKVAMNDKMEPDLNTATCTGKLKTNKVSVGGYEPFNKLGDALKIKELKNLNFDNMDISFEMANGRVKTMPFDVKVNSINTNISGSTGLDETIDYKWKMDIPRAMFGKEANSALTGLLGQANAAAGTNVSLGEKIKVTINFGGTVTNPTIKTGLKDDGGKSTTEAVKDQVVNTAVDKANEEAQKILDDAKAQVDKIKAETQTQVDKMKADGYAEADKLVEQANNPISKIAAKKAAEVAKKEVDKKAQKVVDESDARCQKILDDAKVKADEKANANKK